MIISKTPFRVSFVGGGSDLRSFYKHSQGGVISASIDKYIYLSIHKYFYPDKSLLKYSKTEYVNNIDQIEHNIIREVFRYFNIKNVDFNSTADIPSGTGMGSSSSFTVGLINLCSNHIGKILPNYEVAKLACEIEIEILKEPIGKQDQYGCAFGGLKYIRFNPDESVEINPIFLSNNKLLDLQNNLLLFYTNFTRSASSILSEQNKNTERDKSVKDNLKSMAYMASQLFLELNNGNVDSVGAYLNEAWQRKKKITTLISNPEIDHIYDKAIKNGALGGKLLGAGGGGFFLFYVLPQNQEKLRKSLNSYVELPFNFDFEGTKIIYK
tara:strand:- start:15042 stop:16016 length:975 start_codon:yes stop_codon:yes gene_type:complete